MTLSVSIGEVRGSLKAVALVKSKNEHRMLSCVCECGVSVVVRVEAFLRNKATNCGCKTKEKLHLRHITHGKTGTREYRAFHAMKQRCFNPRHIEYGNYGGRGITVCPEWVDSFETFLLNMGQAPAGFELDRIDPNGNYSPENCRWLSHKQQQRNKRGTIWVEFEGKQVPLIELSEKFGIPRVRVYQRWKRGLPLMVCLEQESISEKGLTCGGCS